jgi:SCY1-like protein 1
VFCEFDLTCRLREETLKSLVHLLDKLDENNLQDKLVRCITNLQQDPENSIRTNATIFLGKLMPRLKDATRSVFLPTRHVIECMLMTLDGVYLVLTY